MILYIPDKDNPLVGRWMDVDHPPKVRPAAVRALWRDRFEAKRRHGYPDANCREWAAIDVAKMLGQDVAMVRRFCRLEQ